ncbi:MAG: ABC transporter substrate-binding protein [Hyphomicrobiaceae bacterium]
MAKMTLRWLGLCMALVAVPVTVQATTLKLARSGDALTLDPHAQNEGPTHNVAHQVYEPLVRRHLNGGLIPTLATAWSVTADPMVWEFKLRPGVKFHDGTPLTADDVIFSLTRASAPTSDHKGLLVSIDSMKKVDDLTVHIKTKGPNPLLVQNLTNLFIMSKAWSEKNNVATPQNFANKEETFAVRNANGTGAYTLVSREPDVKTVLKRNESYWGKGTYPLEVSEIVYTVIKSAPTRVAALLSGEIDFVQDMPVQDITRVAGTQGLKVNVGPENRTIFLGMNIAGPELKFSDVKGKNPFAELKVRQAMNMAIDREAIRKVVMADQSVPGGSITPPFVNGYTKALDAIPARDVAKAKALMAEAGYGQGFGVTLHCPNDRYLNDEKICQAVVGMLGQIGIKVTLDARSKSLHFPQIQKSEVDFYLLGWGVPTYDSEYIFSFLYHTQKDKFGGWNGTRYSNADIDAKIQSLSAETNVDKRNKVIADIWAVLQPNLNYVAIHNQVNAWGMKATLDIPVHPDNQVHIKEFKFKK